MPPTAARSPQANSRRSGRLAGLSGAEDLLFVYGSLRFPEVLEALIGRIPTMSLATAHGWRVAALPGQVYPALVTGTASIDGLTIAGLTNEEWQVLDAFEDELYDLQRLQLSDNSSAWAYVCGEASSVLPADWDLSGFERDDLASYVVRCHIWRGRFGSA
jgi:gamma-glutamylcyclotransferase (GGCT)/AIG2-like uncharacterized protein YtfP